MDEIRRERKTSMVLADEDIEEYIILDIVTIGEHMNLIMKDMAKQPYNRALGLMLKKYVFV